MLKYFFLFLVSTQVLALEKTQYTYRKLPQADKEARDLQKQINRQRIQYEDCLMASRINGEKDRSRCDKYLEEIRKLKSKTEL